MPPPLDPALERYRTILDRIRRLLAEALTSIWDAMPGHNATDIPTFYRLADPYLTAARNATTAASTAFNSALLDIPAPPVNPARHGVSAPLRDPFTSMWHGLAEGRPEAEALQTGRSVAQAIGDTYVTEIARETGDLVTQAAGVNTRWRRVAEPKACDWCKARDGGIYKTARAGNYGHERCRCDVVPDT